MPKPEKQWKAGNLEASVWDNARDMGDGGIVNFKSVTVRKSWRDNANTFREQKLHLRKQDVEKLLVLLRKVQEHLVLEENDG